MPRIYRGVDNRAEAIMALEGNVIGMWWSSDSSRVYKDCIYQIVADVELPMSMLGDYVHHHYTDSKHPGWGYMNMGNEKWYYLHPSYLKHVTVFEVKELGRVMPIAQ